MTASTAIAAERDQSQPVPRSAVARIVITAKYPQIASSDKDWKVAARDRRMRQPSSRCAPKSEQRRGQRDHQRRASRTAPDVELEVEISERVEVEVVDPDDRQREHGEANAGTAGRRRLAIKIVDEDQGAGRRGDAQDARGQRDRARSSRHRRATAAHRRPTGARAPRRPRHRPGGRRAGGRHPRCPSPTGCGAADPDEVARGFGIGRERAAHVRSR